MKLRWFLVLLLAGCGAQKVAVTELTPLEEFNQATEAVDREVALLDKFNALADPNSKDDKKFVSEQEERIRRLRLLREKAAQRLRPEIDRLDKAKK